MQAWCICLGTTDDALTHVSITIGQDETVCGKSHHWFSHPCVESNNRNLIITSITKHVIQKERRGSPVRGQAHPRTDAGVRTYCPLLTGMCPIDSTYGNTCCNQTELTRCQPM
jgi:hypothetical protein